MLYYEKAISLFDPQDVFVFSDDLSWCKENFPKNYIFVSEPDWVCLYMMSLCTAGAILSASMFSSWGAYLGANTNPDSLIIYKYKVIQEKEKPNPYQYPERWVGL
jgi:hypothetical protein